MNKHEITTIVDHALEDLAITLDQGHSQTLATYLGAMARFHQYSWNNILLIANQRPNATYVAGYSAWKRLKRHVRRGEKGIAILAPITYRPEPSTDYKEKAEPPSALLCGFRVVHVFDISQTEGRALPEFATVQGDPGHYTERLQAMIAHQGITLVYRSILGGAVGESTTKQIAVQRNLPAAEEFAVLVHELAHQFLHCNSPRETTPTIRETEAEAVAHVVCRAISLDTNTANADYIHLYQGTMQTLAESLEYIQKTSARILAHIQADA